jgi:hypothetical protein
MALLLWAPVDLRPGGRRLVGIGGRFGFRCDTLTSGIRAEVQKKPGKTTPGHMVTGEPVNVSRGSQGWL